MSTLNVGIIGGGLAGLTLANALRVAGVNYTIFDQSKKFYDVGHGITLNQAAQRVLQKIDNDIWERLIKRGNDLDFTQYDSNGRVLLKMSPITEDQKRRERIYGKALFRGFLRFEIFKELVRPLDQNTIKTGYRVSDFHQDENGVTVNFEGGQTEKFDFLVGADGINSVVRKGLHKNHHDQLGDEPPLTYSGNSIVGASIPHADVINDFGWWLGHFKTGNRGLGWIMLPGRYFDGDSLDLPPNERTEFVAEQMKWRYDFAVADNRFKSIEEAEKTLGTTPEQQLKFLTDRIGTFPPLIKDLVKAYSEVPAAERTPLLPWHLTYVDRPKKATRWGHNRVTLIGDAAHAIVPWIGHGCGLGMEDAYLLAAQLAVAQKQNEISHSQLCDLSASFEKERMPRANFVRQTAEQQGQILFPKARLWAFVGDAVRLINKYWPAYLIGEMDKLTSFDSPKPTMAELKRTSRKLSVTELARAEV